MTFRDLKFRDLTFNLGILIFGLGSKVTIFTLVLVTPHMSCHRKTCATSSLNKII